MSSNELADKCKHYDYQKQKGPGSQGVITDCGRGCIGWNYRWGNIFKFQEKREIIIIF
jgi:hypothetical protein